MAVQPIGVRSNLAGVNQDNLISQNLWWDCPRSGIKDGSVKGFYFEDDFTDFPLPGTQTSEIWLGRYKVYNTGSGKVITDAMPHSATAGTPGGVISMLCDTDGDQSVIGTQASPFLLTTTTTNRKLWFEARVATTSILTAQGQWFVGLCENSVGTYGAAIPLANADATGTGMAMLGFRRLEDGLGVLNTAYNDHAADFVNIQASANSTLAANTWIKLGFKVDMTDPVNTVRFFVDNVECTTAMTKAALLALTYVDVSGLGPCMAFFGAASGTATYTYLDWWYVYQTI